MASPFKFFRKYSSGMMIILVILSMLLFTLTDLFSDPGKNLWLLGLLLGGTGFGVAGAGQGRWLQWGLGGAAFGTLLGFILPGFVEDSGLSTSLGVISVEEMQDLEMRRAVANQMMMQATEASFGQGTARFATLFGFGHGSNREDVVFGKLMRAEADRLGIAVDSSMVNDYLMRATSEKLTTSDYVTIRNNMSYNRKPLNDTTLNEILSDEIKARMAYQMLRPRTTSLPPGPEVYWQYFKRLNVREQLNLATLDVDDFVSEVGEPSDSDINDLFTKYKTKFPNQVEPGSPGFRLPFRGQLAYLELDTDFLESQAGEVTDAEIETYYNANKESSLIRRTVLPDMETTAPATEDKPAEELKTEEPKPAAGEETPDVSETPAKTEEPKPEEKKPEAPAELPAATEPKAAEPTPEEPKAEESAKESTPSAEEPAATEPAATEPAATEPAATEPAATETTDPAGDSCDPFAPDEKTAVEESAVEESKTDEAPPVTATTEAASETAAATTDVSTPTAETPAADEKVAAPVTPTLNIPSALGASVTPQTPDADVAEIQYEYRELNDELKAEIKEEILRQRVKESADEKMLAAVAQMTSLARERSARRFEIISAAPNKFDGNNEGQEEAFKTLREEMKSHDAEIATKLKAFAEDNGLSYVETPLLSYQELTDEDDYPIASATEPHDNPMMAGQSSSVALTTFQGFSNDEQNNDAQLYLVREAQRSTLNLDGGQSRYAYWAIDFSISHVPKIDEPGIKELVTQSWKRRDSRELVKKRGEELAQLVRDGIAKEGDARLDMSQTLKDETATGKPDGSAIAARSTMPFSWLRTSSASPMSFQRPQAQISSIQFSDSTGGVLTNVGEKFMETIFEDMADEEVAVVSNFDMSKHFVVHVTNRYPTAEVGLDALLERFATEGKQFAFGQSPMLGVMQQQLDGPASLEWEKSVWRRYDIDLDEEPTDE